VGWVKKCDFRLRLKKDREGDDQISIGIEFHTEEAKKLKAHVVWAQSYRLSIVDAHTVALQPIHGKITLCYVHKYELSYV